MGCFEEKISDRIKSNGLFEEIDRVLLAVSGGADSVAMAHALHQLAQEGGLSCGFVIGHVNHCLRGAESDADEAFVQELGQCLEIPVVSESADVAAYAKEHKLSIETAGRQLRLKTLSQMAEQNDCDCIATAHHKDDLAETMIHRLMRGTGFRGLCGIRPVSYVYDAEFIRPMLDIRRAEIVQYCKGNSIQWRHDASNADVNFTRNRIRHRLLPVLEAESDNLIDRLAVFSQGARSFSDQAGKQAQDVFDDAISDNQPDRVTLQKARLKNCPPWVFYELIRKVLIMLNVGLRNYTQDHFKTISSLMEQTQANISMPGQIQVFTEKGILGFCRETESSIFPPEPVQFEIGQTVNFGPWRITSKLLNADNVDLSAFLKAKDANVEWFNADKFLGLLEIRRRKKGDQFWPIGAGGEKKVSRFLIDAQLNQAKKGDVFVITDAEKILWVVPIRMCEQAKVTQQTRKILEIRILSRFRLTHRGHLAS
jgi:tRNA(Ile)-lysidine synthase